MFIAFFTTQANFNVEPVFIHGKIRQYLGFTSVYIETPLELTAITTTFLMRGFHRRDSVGENGCYTLEEHVTH